MDSTSKDSLPRLSTPGASLEIFHQRDAQHIGFRFFQRYYRPLLSIALASTDLLVILFSVAVMFEVWQAIRGEMLISIYMGVAPAFIVFPLIYYLSGLYPAIGIGPVDELRRLTVATSVGYMILGTLSFFLRNADQFSRMTFLLSFLLAIVLVPGGRHFLRWIWTKLGWWGEPVVFIGFGEEGASIHQHIISRPELGLKPVAAINGSGSHPASLKSFQLSDVARKSLARELKDVRTALVISSEIPRALINDLIKGRVLHLSHVIMVSRDWVEGAMSVTPYDLAGLTGLMVRHNLPSKTQQSAKRIVDLALVFVSLPFWFPVVAFFALLMQIDSPGPVYYKQNRIGRFGKKFTVWKLRTMVPGAEEELQEYLESNPEHRQEWEADHKMRDDPRITRVGRFLRRFSIDEIPQFINVFKGEMSLIGPRPIVSDEEARFGPWVDVIRQVKPGMSGYWQVSGRNEVPYEQRVKMDVYYVQNWSIWMDFYVILKTFTTILSGKGAY